MLRSHLFLTLGLTILWSAAPVYAQLQPAPAPPVVEQGEAWGDKPGDSKNDDVRRWLERVGGVRNVNPLQRDHSNVRTAFAEVVSETRLATARILVDDLQVALGAIVDADGYVLTKASELHGDVQCALADGRQFPAEIVGVQEEFDLALLHVDAHELPVVRWTTSQPPVGGWLATPNQDKIPAAIGIVSNEPRAIPSPIGYLGVGLDDRRPLVTHVYPGMAAERGGVEVGDMVLQINGRDVDSREQLQREIRRRQPGQRVGLVVRRGDIQREVEVILGDAPTAAANERIEFQNRLGGQLSLRRAGFPSALQHDTVLRPNECGGPLVDLEGRTVALNIARAGRVASYAVPAAAILPLLDELKSGKLSPRAATAKSKRAADVTTPTSVTKIEP
ncbi:MAG: PDZ domain-containing protein [Pirellulales bacterium]